ncbi:uncharacterized protein PFL1_05561 [Pseudozyma flocculosa PF-1]|nr:uncharacterized protein PFL1_05561 [Pseudozyma flocculosa PF-1]EPQ26926.1 hypothetical protein PFL1_05561 [Pseudozyma flocculosa PF-1]
MFDLDESVRALYFAPVPIVVLDQNRRIRMMNRPCESIFLVTGVSCMGQTMEKLISDKAQDEFRWALNEAASNKTRMSWAPPVLTRLSFRQDNQRQFDAEVSVSAWHPTDEVFSEQFNPQTSKIFDPLPENNFSPGTQPPPQPPLSAGGLDTRGAPLLHEAFYTISITPTRMTERRMSPSDLHTNKVDALKEAIFHASDTPMMALSSDGTTVVRNTACDEVLKIFERKNPQDMPKRPPVKVDREDGPQVDLSWLTDVMECYEEDFTAPFNPERFPIYRAAILGQKVKPVLIGCVATDTGARVLLEIGAQPLRDAGGFGQHIGGVITMTDVTAKEKNKKLEVKEQGEAYFRTICDSMPQLLWTTTPDGHHDWYNEGWYRYTGTNINQTEGVGWQNVFHPDDMIETAARWSHSLRTGEPYQTMYRCRRFDGVYKWMLGRALPLRDPATGEILKWYGSCTDCDNEVKALEMSRKAQAQLTSVINHAHVTIWAIDRDAIITVAEGPGVRSLKLAPGTPNGSDPDGAGSMSGSLSNSNSTQPSHGRSEPDVRDGESQTNSQSHISGSGRRAQQKSMIGRNIFDVWDSPGIREALARAMAGESIVQEMEVDGRWFRTQYTPQREECYDADGGEGEIIGVVGASLDITDRRRAESKLEDSLNERSRALAAETAAKEASRIKSEFLANMSHEIRTPIAGVIGLSELLCDTQLTKEQRDFAENIQRSADALLTVINDILDFEKLELGKMDLEKAAFNLNVVIMDTQKMLSFATQKKGLEFKNECDLKYTGQLIGDAGRLRQVMTNLLTNAIKFTAAGSITLRVIETFENSSSLHVHFEVRDTGCGISQTTLKKLFQPFSQADPSFARRFGGTGLGLSICKNLVDLMGGTIGLESIEGKGSNAWFTVPFAKARQIDSGSESSPDEVAISEVTMDEPTSSLGVSENPLQRPRKDIWILVAEDNLINAQIALKTLKKMGFSCRVAKDGLEALDEVTKHPYDCILMDCHMPNCDGYEATRRLRKFESVDIRTLPIIAMTASAIRGDREKCLAAGMSDYLSKPVKSAALEGTLVKWLFDPSTRQSLSKYIAAPTQVDYFNAKGEHSPRLGVRIPSSSEQGGPPKLVERDSNETVVAMAEAASKTPETRAGGADPQVQPALSKVVVIDGPMQLSSSTLATRPAATAAAKAIRNGSQKGGPIKIRAEDPVPSRLKVRPQKLSALEEAMADKPPMFIRRSSREQGGLGRDLEGEVVRATSDGPEGPSLGVSMEEMREDDASATGGRPESSSASTASSSTARTANADYSQVPLGQDANGARIPAGPPMPARPVWKGLERDDGPA